MVCASRARSNSLAMHLYARIIGSVGATTAGLALIAAVAVPSSIRADLGVSPIAFACCCAASIALGIALILKAGRQVDGRAVATLGAFAAVCEIAAFRLHVSALCVAAVFPLLAAAAAHLGVPMRRTRS